jgi:phenylalanyl-tRNA synthetase alpha chain
MFTSSSNKLRVAETLIHDAIIPQGCDETLLKNLSVHPQILEELGPELQQATEQLKKRKLLTVELKTSRTIQITPEGKKAHAENKTVLAEVTQLTPEHIITGRWREIRLQKYNIQAPVAKTYGGKKHPYLLFLDEVRAKLVQLGFQEMTGSAVETCFFNFDALFVPQDHPAREPSDIYYIKDPQTGDVSGHKVALDLVKQVHEGGGKTGSAGWGYRYSLQAAQRLILRGHGTCLSARKLEAGDFAVPSKHFSIARVYRPEITDKTHLSEFNQVEGIIIDENLTLKDLLGVLGRLLKKLRVLRRSALSDYFPFTEPVLSFQLTRRVVAGWSWRFRHFPS